MKLKPAGMSRKEFELFSSLVKEKIGFAFNYDKRQIVEEKLKGLLASFGAKTYCEFLRKLLNDWDEYSKQFVEVFVTKETNWFRDANFIHSVRENILPWLLDRCSGNKVRIWSVAASTGQEPYSIAMMIDEAFQKKGFKPVSGSVEILATDISEEAINYSVAARYNQTSISRGMRSEYMHYFRKDGAAYELEDRIRNMVQFKQLNLLDDFSSLGLFDLVLCRNVLVYLHDDIKQHVYSKLHGAILNDGLLAIGASETSHEYTRLFEPEFIGKSVFYRPKGL